MKDSSIKAVIRRAYWARRDYGNMEHDEYIRHDVAAVLTKRIEEMKALELDRESPFYTEREFEIGMCEEAIRSWQHSCAILFSNKLPLNVPSCIEQYNNILDDIAATMAGKARIDMPPAEPPPFRMYTRPGSPILKCYDGGKKS